MKATAVISQTLLKSYLLTGLGIPTNHCSCSAQNYFCQPKRFYSRSTHPILLAVETVSVWGVKVFSSLHFYGANYGIYSLRKVDMLKPIMQFVLMATRLIKGIPVGTVSLE